MHDLTKENLKTIADWQEKILRADKYVEALDAARPPYDEEGTCSSLDESIGNLQLSVYNAKSLADGIPYLLAARSCGFERRGEMVEEPNYNCVTWRFITDDGIQLSILLHLDATDDSACQYVEVGKKEVPDMRMMCGKELKTWQEAQAAAAE